MTLPFATWTIEEARKAADVAATLKPLIESAQKFYDGDHWQNGSGWIGPAPLAGEEGENEALAQIEKGFISRNVIKEIVDRHRRGVVGQEPDWGFTVRRPLAEDEDPSPEEQKEIDAIEAALTDWWEKRKLHRTFKTAVATLLQAQRSALRLYIPKALTTTTTKETVAADGSKTQVSVRQVSVTFVDDGMTAGLRDALNKLYVDTPPALNAAVYTDPPSQAQVGIVIYKPNVTALNNSDQTEVAELVWVDENRKTVIRSVSASGSSMVMYDMGGQMTIFEMLREPLLTKQVIDNQKALNLAASVVPRSVVTSGFLERILLNAQMPGTWVDESGNPSTDMTTRKRFIPAKYRTGAGTTNFLRGIDFEDPKDQSLKVTDPTAVFREPTPVTAPVEAKRSHYQDMLEETDQSHVLLAAEATPSGRSREQARAGFVSSLNDTKDVADALGRALLEGALAEAEALSGKPNVFIQKYRATFNCRLDAGPIDPLDRAADETSVEKGTMSDESAMTRSGIVDVDAEKARINQSDRGRLDTLKRQGEAMGLWTTAGLSLEGAAEIVIENADPMKVIKKEAALGGFQDPNAPPVADPNAPPNPDPNAPPVPGNPPVPPGQQPPKGNNPPPTPGQ